MFDQALIDYFWSLVDKSDGPDSCWWWLGPDGCYGYGTISCRGKQMGAHRFAALLKYGEIPQGYDVCHSCDNPRCVSHVICATHQANMADMVAKGRFPGRGKPHRSHALYAFVKGEVQRRRALHPAFRKCGIYQAPRPPRYTPENT